MSADVIRELDDAALLQRLDDAREELFNLRFQLATGQLTSPSQIKQVKKEIARCLTETRTREIAAAEAQAGSES